MFNRLIIFFVALCISQLLYAKSEITKVRAWKSPEKTRLVFELTGVSKYKAFLLENPNRLVLDVEKSSIKKAVLKGLKNHS